MAAKKIYRTLLIVLITAICLCAIVLLGLYQDYRKKEIGLQIGCITSEQDLKIVRSFCKSLLFYAPWTKKQLDEINTYSTVSIAIQEASRSPKLAEEYLRLFLKRGANINAQSQMGLRHQSDGTAIPSGLTALHMAAMRGSLEEVTLLLKYGADSNIKDERGRTAIDLAEIGAKKSPDNESYRKVLAILRK